MKLSDLFASKGDGSMSQTKTFTTIAHLVLVAIVVAAVFFGLKIDEKTLALLELYLGVTILHGVYDKTMATVTAYKSSKDDKAMVSAALDPAPLEK